MFRSALTKAVPAMGAARPATSARGMATLQEIQMRLKSVQNIRKITASMKMVSAAKFARAERQLKAARATGPASIALVEKTGIDVEKTREKMLYIIVSADRGLCGGIHSGLAKKVIRDMATLPDSTEVKIAIIGDKPRSILQRTQSDKIIFSANDVGKKAPVFLDAAFAAQKVLEDDYDFDSVALVYNHFKSAISYQVTTRPLPAASVLDGAEELSIFDEVDSDVLQSYMEFTLATNIYYTMLEGQASDQSARMSSMEAATNNAGDMISSLTLLFNRTRQAVITRELVEIISGASALE